MILLLSRKKLLFDLFLTFHIQFQTFHIHPYDFSFHLSVTCACTCVFVDNSHLPLQSLEWLDVNTPSQRCYLLHQPHTSKHTRGERRWGPAECSKSVHIFSLSVKPFLFPSLPHTSIHPYYLSSAVIYNHMHEPEPSELESKVPIAFLISIAPGRVSKSKLCELQSLCMRWTSKLCLIFCIVTFRHLVNSPVVWFKEWYKHIHCQLCMCFLALHVHVGIGWHFGF